MNDLKSLCTTCLSNVEDGSATISEPMCNFLRNELSFKCLLDQRSSKLVCRECYKTLIEIRRFCSQLRDVELYIQTKSRTISNGVDCDLIFNKPEPISSKFGSEVNAEERTLIGCYSNDTILIKPEKAKKMVVNTPVVAHLAIRKPTMQVKTPLKSPKPVELFTKTKSNAVKRVVCLICNKLFSSIEELQTHESSHATPTNNAITTPVFVSKYVAPTPQKQEEMSIDPIRIESEEVIVMDNPIVENPKQPKRAKTSDLIKLISKPVTPAGKKLVRVIYNKRNSCIQPDDCIEATAATNAIDAPATVPINTNPKTSTSPKQKLSCNECGLRFELTKALNTHMKVHQYERLKPFKCRQCNWRFPSEISLRDHELVHMDVEMCVCEMCHKKYYNESSLDAHMRLVHNCTADNVTAEEPTD